MDDFESWCVHYKDGKETARVKMVRSGLPNTRTCPECGNRTSIYPAGKYTVKRTLETVTITPIDENETPA